LAEKVSKYHLRNFSNWKIQDTFESAFARLETICAPVWANQAPEARQIIAYT
jgi:hypothetical protein